MHIWNNILRIDERKTNVYQNNGRELNWIREGIGYDPKHTNSSYSIGHARLPAHLTPLYRLVILLTKG